MIPQNLMILLIAKPLSVEKAVGKSGSLIMQQINGKRKRLRRRLKMI